MKADIIIIGAGISGVSIAWHLAKEGVNNIHVIERDYLTSGATGRCGAGVRQQWATPLNCILAKKSIEFFEKAHTTLDYDSDIEFKQEGYLILGTTEEEKIQFQKNVKLQQKYGIPAILLTPNEAKKIVPHLNISNLKVATFCPTDGHLNPFKMTDAFYQAALKLGVTFHFEEKVTDILTKNNRIIGVKTNKQTFDTDILINAAGAQAADIGKLAGVTIEVTPENHEILVTEPIDLMQGPMVISFSKNFYCQQVPHGNLIMGRSDPYVIPGQNIESTWPFLEAMAKTVTELFPVYAPLRVIRQWGGSYTMSPDRQPIIGFAEDLTNFYMACGFSGHGFMFAPMTGKLIAEMILGKPHDIDIESLSLARFKQGIKTLEQSVV